MKYQLQQIREALESVRDTYRFTADEALAALDALEQARGEPDWDEVFDAAAAAYCRSESSRQALRLCFGSRSDANQVSIGWTANELMDFAKGITRIAAPPAQQAKEPATRKSEWADVPKEFNDWWNDDYDDSTNPFHVNSAAYWAWAGWSARQQAQQESAYQRGYLDGQAKPCAECADYRAMYLKVRDELAATQQKEQSK